MSETSINSKIRLADFFTSKVLSVALAATYCMLLIFLYRTQVFHYYAYSGFEWNPNALSVTIGAALIFSLSVMIPINPSARSAFIFLACYMHFFPSILYFAFASGNYSYLSLLLCGVGSFFIFSQAPVKRVVSNSLLWSQVMWISLFISMLTLSLLVAFLGVGNFNLNFNEIYEFRASTRESLPSMLGYLRPITTKVFLPVFVILAFSTGKLSLKVVSIVLIFAFFALTNHKGVVGSTVVAIVLYYSLRSARNLNYLAMLFVTLLLLCIAEILISQLVFGYYGPGQLASMVARRTLFVPPLLDLIYMEFFQGESFTYWSQSKVGLGIVPRVYDLNAPFLIGFEVFGRETLAANTGFIGSGF